MKIDWIKKLTSRKFWLAVTSFVSLLAVAFGATESQAAQVSAIIMAGASVLGYILAEGLVDHAQASKYTKDDVDLEDTYNIFDDEDDDGTQTVDIEKIKELLKEAGATVQE